MQDSWDFVLVLTLMVGKLKVLDVERMDFGLMLNSSPF
jgi:hypothetical protein